MNKRTANLQKEEQVKSNNRARSVISRSTRSTKQINGIENGSPVIRVTKKAQSNMKLVAMRTLNSSITPHADFQVSTGSLEVIKDNSP